MERTNGRSYDPVIYGYDLRHRFTGKERDAEITGTEHIAQKRR